MMAAAERTCKLSSGQELCTIAPAAMMHGQADCCALSAGCSAAPVLQDVLGLLLPALFPTFELFLSSTAAQLVPCAQSALHPPAHAKGPCEESGLRRSSMAYSLMIEPLHAAPDLPVLQAI